MHDPDANKGDGVVLKFNTLRSGVQISIYVDKKVCDLGVRAAILA
jgi:hypothetical protein